MKKQAGEDHIPKSGMGSKQVVLTSLATLFTQGANSFLLLLLIPLLFTGLGERLFGVYQLSQRLAQFGGLTNLGASSYLKIRLSELPPGHRDEEKRTAIGECLLQWAVLTPILGVWIFAVAQAINAKSPLGVSEIIAVTILIAITPLNQIFAVGQVALFAQGLGYYGIPLAAALGLAATAGAALAAHFGYGLMGVALVLFGGMILRSAATLAVANKMLPWFGVSWPTFAQFKDGVGKSLGASVASLSYLGIQQLESLSFGLALGPTVLARLVLTCVGIQFLDIVVRSFIGTAAYGVAPLIKDGYSLKLARLREETNLNIIALYALSAPLIIGVTPIVIRHWVPTGRVLSPEVGAVVLITSLFRLLSQFDGTLLDQARDFHQKTFYSLALVFAPATVVTELLIHGLKFDHWYVLLPVFMATYYVVVARRVRTSLSVESRLAYLALPLAVSIASLVLTKVLSSSNAGELTIFGSFALMTAGVGLIELATPPLRLAILRTFTRVIEPLKRFAPRMPRRS